jgi:drug/metabolite transporter (DMT)-like permease
MNIGTKNAQFITKGYFIRLPQCLKFLYSNDNMIPLAIKEHRYSGQLAIVAAAVLWSTSGLFIKLIDWHPIVIAGTRSFLAALFILIFRLFFPPAKVSKNKGFPLWACAISFAFVVFTYVSAIKLTTAANAILLQYGAPIWAALLGWYFVKEKPHWEQWGALLFIVAGLFLFFRGGLGQGAFLGNILAIVSGILLGAHSVFLRMLKDGNPMDALLLAHVITAVLSIPFIFLYPPSITVSTALPLVYMGIFQMGISSLFFSYGIKHTTAIQAMLTAIIEPILNPVWVLIVLGEKPSMWALLGGSIIITTVVTSSIIGMRRTERKIHEEGQKDLR